MQRGGPNPSNVSMSTICLTASRVCRGVTYPLNLGLTQHTSYLLSKLSSCFLPACGRCFRSRGAILRSPVLSDLLVRLRCLSGLRLVASLEPVAYIFINVGKELIGWNMLNSYLLMSHRRSHLPFRIEKKSSAIFCVEIRNYSIPSVLPWLLILLTGISQWVRAVAI